MGKFSHLYLGSLFSKNFFWEFFALKFRRGLFLKIFLGIFMFVFYKCLIYLYVYKELV